MENDPLEIGGMSTGGTREVRMGLEGNKARNLCNSAPECRKQRNRKERKSSSTTSEIRRRDTLEPQQECTNCPTKFLVIIQRSFLHHLSNHDCGHSEVHYSVKHLHMIMIDTFKMQDI